MTFRQSALALTLCGVALGAAAPAAGETVTPLFAILLPGNEVTATGQANQGDPESSGSAAVTLIGNKTVCFAIIVTGTDTPTLAHIHTGGAGAVNPPLVNFVAPNAGDPGTSSGCVTTTKDNVKAIRANPSGFYVNVHTQAFPSGAMRGQLF